MNANRLTWAILILWLGTLLPMHAQESAADRRRIDDIKARADKGDAEAQIELSALYTTGNGVPKDLVKAAKLHRKAAEQGNTDAQVRLGFAYKEGEGVPQDYAQAAIWLRKAAASGDEYAQYELRKSAEFYGSPSWMAR